MRALSLDGAELAALSAEVLGRGGAFRFRAHGTSMAPAVRDGDTLTIAPVDPASLRVGDVVLYRVEGGKLAAHRIVQRRTEGDRLMFTARGDAAIGHGEVVRAEQVLGRVVEVQRAGSTIDLERAARLAAARLLARLQGWRPYRCLARWLVGKCIRYRAATVEDAPALSALYGYGRMPEMADPVGTWARHLDSLEGCGEAPVASLWGRIVGTTVIEWSSESAGAAPDWWIWGMRVDARYRGAGVGQGLMRRALEAAREAGASRVYLRVFEDNRAATGLYGKMGFRPAPAAEDGPDYDAGSGGTLWVYCF